MIIQFQLKQPQGKKFLWVETFGGQFGHLKKVKVSIGRKKVWEGKKSQAVWNYLWEKYLPRVVVK